MRRRYFSSGACVNQLLMPTVEGLTKKLHACEAKLQAIKDKKKNRVKRKPSAHNLFMGAMMKKGHTMKEAAAAWNKKKGE